MKAVLFVFIVALIVSATADYIGPHSPARPSFPDYGYFSTFPHQISGNTHAWGSSDSITSFGNLVSGYSAICSFSYFATDPLPTLSATNRLTAGILEQQQQYYYYCVLFCRIFFL